MSDEHLRRSDDLRNMRRFYRLDVQPNLFGGVLLVKEWNASARYEFRCKAKPADRKFTEGNVARTFRSRRRFRVLRILGPRMPSKPPFRFIDDPLLCFS